MKKLVLYILTMLASITIHAQQVHMLSEGNMISLRGLSVVNDDVLWTSGSSGIVGRSTDGGKHLQWIRIPGYEKRDFRDVHAFDSMTAIIMAIDEPGVLLKTYDGGKSWKKVFEDATKGMFLDAMSFYENHGIVVGDPLNGFAYLIETNDGGEHWKKLVNEREQNSLKKGEAFFAASGTNIIVGKGKDHDFMYVSGGTNSALYNKNGVKVISLQSGASTTGANGMALDPSGKYLAIVGGDFSNDKRMDSTIVMLNINKMHAPVKGISNLHGYRSGIAWVNDHTLVACGTSGVDYSVDHGNSWQLISTVGFHAVMKSPVSNIVYFVGQNGRVAKLIY